MGNLLRLFLIAGGVFLLYTFLTRPKQLRAWGRKAQIVGLAYAAAIVISAAIRMAGWGT